MLKELKAQVTKYQRIMKMLKNEKVYNTRVQAKLQAYTHALEIMGGGK